MKKTELKRSVELGRASLETRGSGGPYVEVQGLWGRMGISAS